jgi:hypothetical protein
MSQQHALRQLTVGDRRRLRFDTQSDRYQRMIRQTGPELRGQSGAIVLLAQFVRDGSSV